MPWPEHCHSFPDNNVLSGQCIEFSHLGVHLQMDVTTGGYLHMRYCTCRTESITTKPKRYICVYLGQS